jgi:outer membrane protein assembly factor BamB
MATDGSVVALIDGPDVVCLSFATGAEKWRTPFPLVEADMRAGGVNTRGNLWVGTMIVSDDVVVHASPNNLAGLSAAHGKVLWTQPKKYIGHLWYEWKDVFVIGGLVWTWGAELERGTIGAGSKRQQRSLYPRSANGYDIKTGELKKEVPLGSIFKTYHHHRCYRNKATARYILASRRGTEYVDLEKGRHTVHNWVRGTCHVGMMPANGLQYAPPHPCVCYIEEKLNGMTALAPAGSGETQQPDRQAAALERGPAYPASASGAPATAASWPAFRHDSMRTGCASSVLPDDLAPAWNVKAGSNVSPPIVAAGRLFASLVDEHHVVCLDAADGTKRWEYAAGGRVDSPPTYHRGTVLFGSADGWVYCLQAAGGQLVWRFRAAPRERLIAACGQLESAWPVHGSVLVENGIAYFAAGRSSQLDGGILVCGVDASSGELRHRTRLAGPDYTADSIEENFQLPMGALPDVLAGDGSTIYMRSLAFDPELQPKSATPELQTRSGFLEDSYFKRTPWTLDSQYARLIVHDRRFVYYVRMFDSLQGLNPDVFFTPGGKGYLLFARDRESGRNAWLQRVPVRIRAMVLAPGRLFAAGPPDVMDPGDPLGAFEGRKGGLLYVVDATDGKKLAEHALPSPPVFNGAAAAGGRLYLALEDGSIACFAGR